MPSHAVYVVNHFLSIAIFRIFAPDAQVSNVPLSSMASPITKSTPMFLKKAKEQRPVHMNTFFKKVI